MDSDRLDSSGDGSLLPIEKRRHSECEGLTERSRHESQPIYTSPKNSSLKVASSLIGPILAVLCYAFLFPSTSVTQAPTTCPRTSAPPRTGGFAHPPRDVGQDSKEAECRRTCRLTIVESIPENVSFGATELPMSTFDAWRRLIESARVGIDIAAYKSALRGKHNIGEEIPATRKGSRIFESLVEAGTRGLAVRMVENTPSKDPGDNADGEGLVRRGAVERRSLDLSRILGRGMMHSKFLVVDDRHFYIGSANLDWRSLNQKMELGVLLQSCPCLGEDMKGIFGGYWALSDSNETVLDASHAPPSHYSRRRPLRIEHGGVPTNVYVASSPRQLNGAGRTWDLEAILATIDDSEKFLYIHVMDYIPMIVYTSPQKFWPIIDEAVRRAVMERGVEVRLLAAALHFVPQTLRFLKSLATINGAAPNGGSIAIKIFKVPVVTEEQRQPIIARDRRTHNKFVVTEQAILVGTSNWSGDYFLGSTGLAFVATQNETTQRPLVDELKGIFIRDWVSPYAHNLKTILDKCLYSTEESELCEESKKF